MKLPSGTKFEMPFASTFAGMKPRERALAGVMALLALVGAVYYTMDLAQTAAQEDIQAQVDLRTARSGTTGALAKRVAEQTGLVRGWTWVAATPAVGKVVMEDELAGIALRSGMQTAEIRAADNPTLVGDVYFVDVTVSAPFTWQSLSAFLNGLDALGKGFMIESVAVSDDVAPKLRLVVKLPLTATEPVAVPARKTVARRAVP